MASLTSAFNVPCTSQPSKPRRSFPLHLHSFSLRLHSRSSTRWPSISTTMSARRGGGGGGASGRSKCHDDEAIDMSYIRSDTVRLIDEQQKMVAIVSKAQACQMAENAELDLVILSPDADPPVVRIMDHSYNIDVHDYSVLLKAAQKFSKDGDNVKVIVNLKGRENEFRNNAIELIRCFQNDIGQDLARSHALVLRIGAETVRECGTEAALVVSCRSYRDRYFSLLHKMLCYGELKNQNREDKSEWFSLVLAAFQVTALSFEFAISCILRSPSDLSCLVRMPLLV